MPLYMYIMQDHKNLCYHVEIKDIIIYYYQTFYKFSVLFKCLKKKVNEPIYIIRRLLLYSNVKGLLYCNCF